MSYCILSGNIANWETAIANRIWGVKSTLKKYWDKLQPNDVLFFYCTSPVSGIIGYGRLTSKKGDQTIPLWADEVNTGTVIYPFRFEFEIEYVLESRLWQEKRIPIKDLGLSFMSGLNFQQNTSAVESLTKRVKENWNSEVLAVPGKQVQPKIPTNLHDEIKEKIKRIGKLRGYLSETEYDMGDGRRLDIVWRAKGVTGGVPKYVFEVEIGGDSNRAMAKLKHAFDLWGFPKLYLITTNEKMGEVNRILGGTFHEIKDFLRIVVVEKIDEFYQIELKESEIRRELGINGF